MIEKAKGREIAVPGPAGYESSVVIIANAIKQWHDPALKCVESTHTLMGDWFAKKRDHVLDAAVPDKYRLLRDEMSRIVTGMLEDYKRECIDIITRLWKMEQREFTMNDHYMATNRREYRALVDKILSGNDLDAKLEGLNTTNKTQLRSLLGSLGLSTEKLKLIPTSSTYDDE